MNVQSYTEEALNERVEILQGDVEALRAELAEARAERQAAMDRCDKLIKAVADVADRVVELEAESDGRLKAVYAKADEARTEWLRAERAEAELAENREALRWNAQTVHQAHHGDETETTFDYCPRNTCTHARGFLKRHP